MDVVTLLTNADNPPKNACKIHRLVDGARVIQDYPPGAYQWTAEEVPVTSLAELAALLERIRQRRSTCVVRGKPKSTTEPILRRFLKENPGLSAASRRWVCLDIDKHPTQGIDFAKDPKGALEAYRSTLPAPWSTAACYWQASSGAGINPGEIRAHLWYWLDAPMSDAECRKAFAVLHKNGYNVDTSLYTPIQPHFTADPVFEGVSDPMEQRTGFLQGSPEAQVSLIQTPSVKQWELAEKNLKQVCKFIANLKEGERGKRIYAACKELGRKSILDDKRITADVFDAGLKTGLEHANLLGHIHNGLRDGRGERTGTEEWRKALRVTDDGEIVPCLNNFVEIVTNHPALAGAFAWRTRSIQGVVLRDLPWRGPGPVADIDVFRLQTWFDKELHLRVTKPDAMDLLLEACQRAPQDSFADYLGALTWDGTERLNSVYRLFEVEPSAYAEATFKYWFISAVARTFLPGCQADHMLVLQGAQGFGKSSGLKALAPHQDDYATLTARGADLADKDTLGKIHGPAIVCLEELAVFKGREAETVKSFITETVDRFRPWFGRSMQNFPRRVVFCGTSNADTFLTDSTGGRRFWPHNVQRPINVDNIVAVRDQLWAEAVHLFNQPRPRWWLTPEETRVLGVKEKQEERREVGPLEEQLEAIVFEQDEWTTAELAAALATSFDVNRYPGQFGAAMRALGFKKHRRAPVKGKMPPRVWRRG